MADSVKDPANKPGAQKPKQKPKPKVADSWEDASVSSSEDEEDTYAADTTSLPPQTRAAHNDAPPLAPSSIRSQWSPASAPQGTGSPRSRPEKQTAVASRIISNALGVRTQRTEEQKAYDRAVLESERRKREREREAARQTREAEEKAKQAVWES
ncbi:predicted protein [Uncinocarpus reesii 1704]|uniref:Casein kinase substrate phosphoprotein PP28 domain-containing protein n=1 Tax=Uncinocarpus reesii (strain UAMH 1704) TaxID=336963 RepID=C4JTY7_UNCRE|nr:uncharacterized protein UREG_05926 [Uncinocarpus reesii 1704]EEP81084.1 predicted protein [Uncinocarpus reesii 1704]